MKNLTFIAIVLLISCGNPKAKIVEQIKAYKDSSGMISAQISLLTDATMEDKKFQLIKKQADYQNKIDSLELELKKY